MTRSKLPWLVGSILLLLGLAAVQVIAAGRGDSDDGMRFTMVMEVPGQDSVEFTGTALGRNSRLEGRVGGILSVKLLSDGQLFILTPAIKTAQEIDSPDIPDNGSDTWPEWLSEPGRINPLTFAGSIGQDDDVSGTVEPGRGGQVSVVFEDGMLKSVRFPNQAGEGMITYTYSGFEVDGDLTVGNFEIPDDYLLTD